MKIVKLFFLFIFLLKRKLKPKEEDEKRFYLYNYLHIWIHTTIKYDRRYFAKKVELEGGGYFTARLPQLVIINIIVNKVSTIVFSLVNALKPRQVFQVMLDKSVFRVNSKILLYHYVLDDFWTKEI